MEITLKGLKDNGPTLLKWIKMLKRLNIVGLYGIWLFVVVLYGYWRSLKKNVFWVFFVVLEFSEGFVLVFGVYWCLFVFLNSSWWYWFSLCVSWWILFFLWFLVVVGGSW